MSIEVEFVPFVCPFCNPFDTYGTCGGSCVSLESSSSISPPPLSPSPSLMLCESPDSPSPPPSPSLESFSVPSPPPPSLSPSLMLCEYPDSPSPPSSPWPKRPPRRNKRSRGRKSRPPKLVASKTRNYLRVFFSDASKVQALRIRLNRAVVPHPKMRRGTRGIQKPQLPPTHSMSMRSRTRPRRMIWHEYHSDKQ